ncbi:MAG: prolyl oligopeptidase family serine peptidase [Gemmatimonadetes bacterium]|nr:prolyl oligopeptidase family serine peptidase [Gemmatimonadota bacterium]
MPRPAARLSLAIAALAAALAAPASVGAQAPFTLAQVHSYPYPTELVAAPTGARIAWVFDEKGVRNVYGAEAPGWKARRLTDYTEDDGQELTQLHFSPDGGTVVYVRGGDHGSNWKGELEPDPMGTVLQRKIQIFAVPFAGGEPKLLADGDGPAVSSTGLVAFVRGGEIWTVGLDGSGAARLFFDKGRNQDPTWAPDGHRLAFVSARGDHSFIGIYTDSLHDLLYLNPSTERDFMPVWSPDGARIAFVRLPGAGGAPDPWLTQTPRPWEIHVADSHTGQGRVVWRSPNTLRGSYPTTQGRANLHWGAGDRLTFLADMDGWAHLYSVPVAGGEAKLLTPHDGMAEYISMSPDGRYLTWAGNMGDGAHDIERRHIFRVGVDGAGFQDVTPGTGIEWTPVVTADGAWLAYLGGGARRPPLPHVRPANGGGREITLGQDRVPADFPTDALVVPTAVTFHAADGVEVHADVFEPRAGAGAGLVRGGKRPAVIFVHGGPPRQMLLGWHYSYYYSNAYAVNQFMASRGYVVLSVNYRLGIGYGHDFHHPDDAGMRGASEYRDIKAAGEYLAALPQVDASRIGLWGGSYGGYLTALGLGRDSDLFAAGVDMHGVHDWTSDAGGRLGEGEWRYEVSPAELQRRADIAWKSSPVAWVDSWRSPVLLIQGDDDRNVRFHQTVDLVQRLRAHGVPFQEMVIPDEIHDFLRHASWMKADSATVAFFDKHFGGAPGGKDR